MAGGAGLAPGGGARQEGSGFRQRGGAEIGDFAGQGAVGQRLRENTRKIIFARRLRRHRRIHYGPLLRPRPVLGTGYPAG